MIRGLVGAQYLTSSAWKSNTSDALPTPRFRKWPVHFSPTHAPAARVVSFEPLVAPSATWPTATQRDDRDIEALAPKRPERNGRLLTQVNGSSIEELTDIRADRRLLIPGPCPPLTHLGATLLRHSVHVSLRFALYQLGQALPQSPPTRFVALRLYFDAPALSKVLGARVAGREIACALLDPAGTATVPLPKRLRGTLWFHRRRLLVKTSSLGRAWRKLELNDESEAVSPEDVLSRHLPSVADALLGDLVAVLDRRQARAAGHPRGPVQSLEAGRFLAAKRANLSRLGPPEVSLDSWSPESPGALEPSVASRLAASPHRLRGGFREQYRELLNRFRPAILARGRRAVDRGYLRSEEDVFFMPFELTPDLEGERKPPWLAGAVESNRREWLEVSERGAPADTLGNVEPAPPLDAPAELLPLWPLA